MPEESTTPDLVELTRQANDALSRRDIDAYVGFFAPGGVWDASQPGVGVFEGRAAIRAFLEDWLALYEDFEIELAEILDLGHGVVFSVSHQTARLMGSEGSVRETYASTATNEVGLEGLAARVVLAQDIDEARAAAERLAEERGRRAEFR
jgi:ketosteroid isomerase-like protein